MKMSLFDPNFGYYMRNSDISVGGHFCTHPLQNQPYYGAYCADLVFFFWNEMVERGIFTPDEPFDVIEFGAGTGVLARDFMTHVKARALSERGKWEQFYHIFLYTIGEISPDLREKQKRITEPFRDKLKIIPLNILKVQQSLDQGSVKGIILSNELPDTFPIYKVRKKEDGN